MLNVYFLSKSYPQAKSESFNPSLPVSELSAVGGLTDIYFNPLAKRDFGYLPPSSSSYKFQNLPPNETLAFTSKEILTFELLTITFLIPTYSFEELTIRLIPPQQINAKAISSDKCPMKITKSVSLISTPCFLRMNKKSGSNEMRKPLTVNERFSEFSELLNAGIFSCSFIYFS